MFQTNLICFIDTLTGEYGKYFDPRIVEVFLEIEKEFHEIRLRYK